MKKISESNPWEFRDNGEKVLTYVFCFLGVVLGAIFLVAGINYLITSQYSAKVPCSLFCFMLSLAFFVHGVVFLPDRMACRIINWFKRKT